MAGRGRGRGRGLSINIEALGLGRGEILPTVAQPPPLYPPLLYKPVPLAQSDDLSYMLALKQELRESFQKSSFNIKTPNKVKDIERYSDKYQIGANEAASTWTPDWTRLPHELKEREKRKRKLKVVKPNLKAARQIKDEDVSSLLEKLEQNDGNAENAEEADNQEEGEEEEVKKTQKDGEGDDEEEEEYDEEDLEEETDYNMAYFDNGEGYGDDDEDDDEGPTY